MPQQPDPEGPGKDRDGVEPIEGADEQTGDHARDEVDRKWQHQAEDASEIDPEACVLRWRVSCLPAERFEFHREDGKPRGGEKGEHPELRMEAIDGDLRRNLVSDIKEDRDAKRVQNEGPSDRGDAEDQGAVEPELAPLKTDIGAEEHECADHALVSRA